MKKLHVFDDEAALVAAVADLFIEQARAGSGAFSVALPGGSTPRPLFARLTAYDQSARINWSEVHVFFGDERAVPSTHQDSNYAQAQTALLGHVPIPLENVHRIQGELGAEEAAKAYGKELQAFFDGGPPAFNLHILGMGEDGHTASLFPGVTGALHETKHRAVATSGEHHEHERITMTPWAIGAAQQVVVMVSGEHKAEILKQVLEGPHQPETYPIQAIQPRDGLNWYVDAAAASRLSG